MKNLMKILSVLILFCGIVSAASIIMDPRSVGEGLYEFSTKILAIFRNNIIFIVAMAICCYCLERNDNNYLTRIIGYLKRVSSFNEARQVEEHMRSYRQ